MTRHPDFIELNNNFSGMCGAFSSASPGVRDGRLSRVLDRLAWMQFIKPGMYKTRPQETDKIVDRLQQVRIQLRVTKEVPRGQVTSSYAASRFSVSLLLELFCSIFAFAIARQYRQGARAIPVRMRS